MTRRALSLALLFLVPAVAEAGMPSFQLTDVARLRIENLSFFLMLLLLSAAGLRWLWNWLQKDWPALPRLTFGKALGLVVLWGLVFVLVLTMISGARELLTPGAWEKVGLTYRVKDAPLSAAEADWQLERAREQKLHRLRVALWDYALRHDLRFPAGTSDPAIPQELWEVADASGMQFVYRPGLGAGDGARPLAFEPDLFGPQRFVLFTNGEVKRLTTAELTPLLEDRP
jgi:hypothetical protein